MVADDSDEKMVEAMEQLRISFTMRQWRVCALMAEALADKFKDKAADNGELAPVGDAAEGKKIQ
jgi:hypothetical protein